MMHGIVIKVAGSIQTVRTENGDIIECNLKGNFRTRDLKSTNPVVVGDMVAIDIAERAPYGFITEIQDRKNYIIRKSTNLSRQHQIIAANVDQSILIVTLAFPETNSDFINRYLVSSEAFSIPTILLFNKVDVYDDEANMKRVYYKKVFTDIGYQCIESSIKEGKGIDTVREILRNKTTVLSGNSGVGKSSLINALIDGLNTKTGAISAYHNTGKHTTSFSEMFALHDGGYIIDTPGIKAFGLIDFDKDELYHYFPEIFKISNQCKFYNCTHIHEPGCAVRQAVDSGNIDVLRYAAYYSMYNDENTKYRNKP